MANDKTFNEAAIRKSRKAKSGISNHSCGISFNEAAIRKSRKAGSAGEHVGKNLLPFNEAAIRKSRKAGRR